MKTLFIIESERVNLTFSLARGKEPAVVNSGETVPGTLHIKPINTDLKWKKVWRRDVPESLALDPDQIIGPRLYEQTDYALYASTQTQSHIQIKHRDPVMLDGLDIGDHGRTVYGYVNFRSQIGHSKFSVLVDGQPEFDFEVEVFPTKMDYASDYEKIMADVQDILTGLALEYLRSTYQLGSTFSVIQPSNIEWLTLLRSILHDLEQALFHISRQPLRELKRDLVPMRAEQIKHIDSAVRSAVRRGAGKGAFFRLDSNTAIREEICANRSRITLDTMEHRWLKTQLCQINQRLTDLRRTQKSLKPTLRRDHTIHELENLEKRIMVLRSLEPIKEANGQAPSGFASLQLLGSPGYREAFKACMVLNLGLRIEGGPLRLSVKDLNLLYEYWCYLAFLRIISEETGQSIPSKEIFTVKQKGLQVLLQQGRQNEVVFKNQKHRRISVTYNQKFNNEEMLIPQKPDLVVTIENKDWPKLRLVLDAKYRLDGSENYIAQYYSPGPPQDALNAMHRYRDAILEYDSSSGTKPHRTVIQAAALFPYQNDKKADFKDSKLWNSLARIGVGALPFLPQNTGYVKEWLHLTLEQGGFSAADRTIAYSIHEQAQNWQIAATEPVLVGVLRAGGEKEHLDWIIENKMYYMPVLKTQLRQYNTKWLAIYSPLSLRKPGAVTHYAPIEEIEVVKRNDIITPWTAKRGKDELQVLYRLGEIIELSKPIENRGKNNQGQRFSNHRWTSRLALQRARRLEELLLETEPEWRLYEDLQAMNIDFILKPGPVKMNDPDNPRGRVWFILKNNWGIRYGGSSGFVLKKENGIIRYFLDYQDIIKIINGFITTSV